MRMHLEKGKKIPELFSDGNKNKTKGSLSTKTIKRKKNWLSKAYSKSILQNTTSSCMLHNISYYAFVRIPAS